MTILQITIDEPTEAGWPLRVTFRGETRTGLLYQRAGDRYLMPDGTTLDPKPSWWLRMSKAPAPEEIEGPRAEAVDDPVNEEWLGDADDKYFLNILGMAARKLWPFEIDAWRPETKPMPAAPVVPGGDACAPSDDTQAIGMQEKLSAGARLLPKMPLPPHLRRTR